MSGKLVFLKFLLLLHYTTFTGPIMMMLVPAVPSSTAIRSSPSSLEYNLLPFQSSSSLLSLSDLLNGGASGGGGSRFVGEANSNIVNNNQVESMLETLMEGGAKVLLLVPPRDDMIEKRDPLDVGAGRSHSGNKAVNTLRGQSVSYNPVGPGRKKRWRGKRNVAPVAGGDWDGGEDQQY